MSSTPHVRPLPPEAGSPPDVATPSRPRGHGWVVFAALMIALAGVFNVIAGLVALADSRFYAAGAVYWRWRARHARLRPHLVAMPIRCCTLPSCWAIVFYAARRHNAVTRQAEQLVSLRFGAVLLTGGVARGHGASGHGAIHWLGKVASEIQAATVVALLGPAGHEVRAHVLWHGSGARPFAGARARLLAAVRPPQRA